MDTKVLFNTLCIWNSPKIKGDLYSKKEDFIVQEINSEGEFFDMSFEELSFPKGKKKHFVRCILVKEGISTFESVAEIGDIIGIKKEEIKYSGLKDTFGITSQEITLSSENFFKSFDKLKQKRSPFFLKEAKFVEKHCKIRNLKGNHFCVTLRNFEEDAVSKLDNLNLKNIPNFYGHQRFGIRQNLHLVGKELVKRNYGKAIKIFCTYSNNESSKLKKIRNELISIWGNWGKCLNLIQKEDGFADEKKIFEYLIKKEDPIGALNETGLTLFSVNSYSSYIFNKVLNNLLARNIEISMLPVLGYETKFINPKIKEEYEQILLEENVSIKDFFNEDYNELSYSGRDKGATFDVEDFIFREDESKIVFEFSLPMGVYANLFLDRIIENKSGRIKLE